MNFKNDWTGADDVQAQRDEYKGIEFRSKLESKTAQALDNIGIAWEYEPDGYKLTNGMWYRPDFYLPGCGQFIECKGVMSSKDSAKIIGLVEDTSLPVLALSYTNAMLFMRSFNAPGANVVTHAGGTIWLSECLKCGARWFLSYEDTWKCPACGAHEGDHHFRQVAEIESATALFDYGQRVAASKPIYKQIANEFNG